MNSRGIVFYTDNLIEEPIKSVVQRFILAPKLHITACSLGPIDFGNLNITVQAEPSYITYLTQIVTALEHSPATYVFFCEHDVIYPLSHFDFTPLNNDTFYYNANVYRWKFGSDFAITYDGLISLSGLCVNREFALDHFQRRLSKAKTMPKESNIKEPSWARAWGYEVGLKRTHNGGFSNEKSGIWSSELPIVDIRHKGTMTKDKVTLDSFKHPPTNWREIPVKNVPGWDIIKLFNL
jgi:hypothetical protein